MFSTVLLIILVLPLAALACLWIFGERGRLLRPSTWRGMRASGLRNLLNLNGIHMYVYGRWTKEYISALIHYIFPRLGGRGRKWLSDRYHGKTITTEQAKAIIVLDRDIPLRDLEQIIPYPVARSLLLKGPPDVAAYECACRHARVNSCEPTQVCMVVGQPFVDFILEHHPRRSRRLAQQEALDLLEAEHDRGHFHSAWFKDAMLDRFYAICNCCKCCCGGLEAMVKYGIPMVASSGFVAKVDDALCSVCGICVDACPFGALSMNGNLALDRAKCMGCGVCAGQCPTDSIALVRDAEKGVPFDVRTLTS